VQAHREFRDPPPVTATQWLLILAGCCVTPVAYVVPEVHALQGVTLIHLGLSIGLCSSTAWECLRTRSPGKFILAFAMLAFFWIDVASLAMAETPLAVPVGMPVSGSVFSVELVQGGLIRVAVFQCLLFAGYSLRPKAKSIVRWCKARMDDRSSWRWSLRYAMALASFAPLVAAFGADPDVVANVLLAARSGYQAEWRDPGLVGYFSTIGYFGVGLLAVEAYSAWPRRPYLALAAALAAAPYILGGARHHTLNVMIPVLLWSLVNREPRRRASRNVWLAAACVAFFVILVLQSGLRSTGWTAIGSVTVDPVSTVNMTGMFSALLFALYLVPATRGHFFEVPESYFLVHWIPRSYWAGKPAMVSWEYYNAAWTQGAAFNVTPSVIGQYHLNFGFAGIVYIGLLLGLLTSVIDRLVLAARPGRQIVLITFCGLAYAFIAFSFRYYAPLYFAYSAFGFFGMVCLTRRISGRRESCAPARVFA
jgi:hypothetical protein